MTDKQQGNQETIDRYLANRLSDAERELFETRIVGDPAFRHEVELTEALRDGLRELQKQGEVAPLLRPRSWMWSRSPFAIAASVLALALGVTIFLFYQRLDDGSRELATETLRFEHTRSGDVLPDLTWQQSPVPMRMEMRFDVGLEPAAKYRVIIDRVATDATAPVFETLVGLTAEGEVSITMHSTLLETGDYRIRLEPQSPATMQEPTLYTMRIVSRR